MNQLKETLEAKENEIRAEKDRLKRTETDIVFDRDALMDKSNGVMSVLKTHRNKKSYRGDSLS